MANFCQNCGTALGEGAAVCPACGTQVAAPVPAGQAAPAGAGNGAVRQNIPAPGFSDRVNHPEILAAVRKNRKAAGIFAFFLVPLPLLGFFLYSQFSDKMETADALKYGAIVSAIFLVFALYSFIKERAKNTYEATVIDKKTRRASRRNGADNSTGYYTEYITVVRTTAGKKKKIVEQDGSQIWAWDYLQVGDRFKYHPQFHFPYELYDKSKAPYIACISCCTKNPTQADRCQKCNLPLLK